MYLVYLILRSSTLLPNLSSPSFITRNVRGSSGNSVPNRINENIGGQVEKDGSLKKEGSDYHLTTRRISKVLLGRVTSLVLISQLIYLIYWWGVLPTNGYINNLGGLFPTSNLNTLELY